MSLLIKIADEILETKDDLPISIKYRLEDDDFQRKTSDQAFNILAPFTVNNQKIANNYQNPGQEDLTPDQFYKNPRKASVSWKGAEILNGKAFLVNASPNGYEFSLYGGNASWIIDLKESTLYDFLKHVTIPYTKAHIASTFAFNGYDENVPYVFAPIKYRGFMDESEGKDSNVLSTYLKPSISPYWIIYWALKSVGYRLESDFMNTEYFRRLVMPWTWGNFLYSEGTDLQVHKFLAKSLRNKRWHDFTGEPDMEVSNDSTDGAYDNNNDYSFVTNRMVWEYKAPHFGPLEATLSCQISHNATLVGSNTYCHYKIQWYHFDSGAGTTTLFKEEKIIWQNGRNLKRTDIVDIKTWYASKVVNPGDKIICATNLDQQSGKGIGARVNIDLEVLSYQLEYFRIPLGGQVNFQNLSGFKKHKFLDMLSGIFDMFDLVPYTDPINKIVRIEPSHPYSLTNDLSNVSGGYFNGNSVDWSNKKDLTGNWKLGLYSDYEQELLFKFKEDNTDGIVKILQDRNSNILSMGKYVFPNRFKAGKKEFTNRFFATVAHYDCVALSVITGIAPQLICIIPENLSGTSNSEAGNTFAPKLAYYKGMVSGQGGWKLDGVPNNSIPTLFAVNYRDTTGNDPVRSYCDERMNNGLIVKGLLKRFFWQRLAIMRNGQYFTDSAFMLNNNDVMNNGHREFKIIDGIKYELQEIEGYKPNKNESSPCKLRKWVPVSIDDSNNTYPSANAFILPAQPLSAADVKYTTSKCLISDIP